MYAGHGENYFLAGLSAIACVEAVLSRASPGRIRCLLDLPSGFGRELRFFALRFPEATMTVCDIQPEAVGFCAREFGAVPVVSRSTLSDVSFDGKFDLIWCGSLVTHLDGGAIDDLLKLFSSHLSHDGIFIFTFHGDYVYKKMAAGRDTYELAAESLPALVASYEQTGYAYQDYPRGLGYFEFHPEKSRYGISLTSPDWLRSRAELSGSLREVYFKERGWADHQDVLAFAKRG
jgi:SAM-dependent methyltransferase